LLFLFHSPSPSQIFPLSLHDALPISGDGADAGAVEIRHLLEVEQNPLAAVADQRVHPLDEAVDAVFEDESVGEIEDDDAADFARSEEHTSELQSRFDLVCRLLLEKKK